MNGGTEPKVVFIYMQRHDASPFYVAHVTITFWLEMNIMRCRPSIWVAVGVFVDNAHTGCCIHQYSDVAFGKHSLSAAVYKYLAPHHLRFLFITHVSNFIKKKHYPESFMSRDLNRSLHSQINYSKSYPLCGMSPRCLAILRWKMSKTPMEAWHVVFWCPVCI